MIPPKVSFALNIGVAVLAVIVAGGPHLFPAYVPDAWSAGIVQTCAFLVALATGINGALHGYSSAAAGPLTASTPTVPKAAAVILLALLALPLVARDARAEEPTTSGDLSSLFGGKKGSKLSPTNPLNLINDLNKNLTDALDQLASWVSGDLTSAANLAVANPGLVDGNGQACWIAAQAFGAIFKEHPIPVTLKAATDIEALRLEIAAADELCANTACNQVSAEFEQGIGTLGLGLSLPAFSAICAKIPKVSLVPSTVKASTTPAPTPSPTTN